MHNNKKVLIRDEKPTSEELKIVIWILIFICLYKYIKNNSFFNSKFDNNKSLNDNDIRIQYTNYKNKRNTMEKKYKMYMFIITFLVVMITIGYGDIMDKVYNFNWLVSEIDQCIVLKLLDGDKLIGIYQVSDIGYDLDEIEVKFANIADLEKFILHSAVIFRDINDNDNMIRIPVRKLLFLFINSNEIDDVKEKLVLEYVKLLNHVSESNNYMYVCLFVTDVLNNGSYILYTNGCEEMIKDSFNLSDVYEGIFIECLTSRKKQVIPYINDYIK